MHGMVLVSHGRMLVPTCLCGWVGAGLTSAMAVGMARSSWEGHVELEKGLDIVDAAYQTEGGS